mmetsp:Transcript_4449/g.10480  ORF Transcript_4449/g.10480 Transcript_4449/m.10480 type:complete len:264 (-) Transcript_4449:2437-3228(-)
MVECARSQTSRRSYERSFKFLEELREHGDREHAAVVHIERLPHLLELDKVCHGEELRHAVVAVGEVLDHEGHEEVEQHERHQHVEGDKEGRRNDRAAVGDPVAGGVVELGALRHHQPAVVHHNVPVVAGNHLEVGQKGARERLEVGGKVELPPSLDLAKHPDAHSGVDPEGDEDDDDDVGDGPERERESVEEEAEVVGVLHQPHQVQHAEEPPRLGRHRERPSEADGDGSAKDNDDVEDRPLVAQRRNSSASDAQLELNDVYD